MSWVNVHCMFLLPSQCIAEDVCSLSATKIVAVVHHQSRRQMLLGFFLNLPREQYVQCLGKVEFELRPCSSWLAQWVTHVGFLAVKSKWTDQLYGFEVNDHPIAQHQPEVPYSAALVYGCDFYDCSQALLSLEAEGNPCKTGMDHLLCYSQHLAQYCKPRHFSRKIFFGARKLRTAQSSKIFFTSRWSHAANTIVYIEYKEKETQNQVLKGML